MRVLLWVIALPFLTGAASPPPGDDTCPRFDHAHARWTALLARFVDHGIVDYATLKRTARGELDQYLQGLEQVQSACFAGFTKEQRFAFWINAYNAYTVKLILDHYPLKSIRSIGLLPLAAFRSSFIPLRVSGSADMSLNDIENEQLRNKIGDPRLHFTIVCASTSCPTLRPEAYRAAELDRQLDAAARAFINDTTKNRYDGTSKVLRLSSIFKWFRGDFERSGVTLGQFVARYLNEQDRARLSMPNPDIEFLDYDWSLNGK